MVARGRVSARQAALSRRRRSVMRGFLVPRNCLSLDHHHCGTVSAETAEADVIIATCLQVIRGTISSGGLVAARVGYPLVYNSIDYIPEGDIWARQIA